MEEILNYYLSMDWVGKGIIVPGLIVLFYRSSIQKKKHNKINSILVMSLFIILGLHCAYADRSNVLFLILDSLLIISGLYIAIEIHKGKYTY